jgi:hypothetical protein
MEPVLETRHRLHDLGSLRHQAPQLFYGLFRRPDLREKAAGVQLGHYCGVDLVSLYHGMPDRAHLQWIGDHHALHERTQLVHSRRRVSGCPDHHLVVLLQLPTECDLAILVGRMEPELTKRPPGWGHHTSTQRRCGANLGEQRNLFAIPSGLVERLDRLAPRSALAVVYLAQIQRRAAAPSARQIRGGSRQCSRCDDPYRPCGEASGTKT